MKRIIAILSVIVILLTCFSGCGKKSELSSSEPVTLTMWHVYGEQADSPMNKLVDEFNRTVGKENGVIINVTLMTNASMVGPQLLEAQAAYVFVKWFTESNRNLDFVAETGYMPVRKDAFEKIGDYEFKNADYESLYDAIEKTNDTCVALTEPNFDGYYDKIYKLYDAIRLVQKGTEEVGADYLWEIFTSVE